jgi:hypothetical protein
MKQFRAAWDEVAADPARLTDFLQMKRASNARQAYMIKLNINLPPEHRRRHGGVFRRVESAQARRDRAAPASCAQRAPEASRLEAEAFRGQAAIRANERFHREAGLAAVGLDLLRDGGDRGDRVRDGQSAEGVNFVN